jgi:hypothetical protein
MRCTIHDRKGKPVTPIDLEFNCSWVLSSEGKASFDFALIDPKARELILNAGNLLHIEIDDLPFDWGGVIDGDEDWNEDETITLSAWSGEHLLSFRRTPVDQTYTAPSAGAMIRKLLDMANATEDTLIRAGSIFEGGGECQDTWDGKNIYDHVKSVAENSGVEWNVDPAIDANGYLYFRLNVYERRGAASNMVLEEGHNIKKRGRPLRVRTGDIVNDLLGLGDASTDSRQKYYAPIHEQSRSKYGLRQATKDFYGVTNPKTLENDTKEHLRLNAFPRRIHQIDALNVGQTFNYLGIGNTNPLRVHTYGWNASGGVGMDGTVRILGIRYRSREDIAELTNEEEV